MSHWLQHDTSDGEGTKRHDCCETWNREKKGDTECRKHVFAVKRNGLSIGALTEMTAILRVCGDKKRSLL